MASDMTERSTIKLTKLTKPQMRTLLKAARHDRGVLAIETYPPIVKLLSLGLVERNEKKTWGTSSFIATDAGRAFLRGEAWPAI